jgi:hypothetical protein
MAELFTSLVIVFGIYAMFAFMWGCAKSVSTLRESAKEALLELAEAKGDKGIALIQDLATQDGSNPPADQGVTRSGTGQLPVEHIDDMAYAMPEADDADEDLTLASSETEELHPVFLRDYDYSDYEFPTYFRGKLAGPQVVEAGALAH